jgi:hypothetical protein
MVSQLLLRQTGAALVERAAGKLSVTLSVTLN